MKWFYLIVISTLIVFSCNHKSGAGAKKKLPILGRKSVENIKVAGGIKADTVYHTVPDFSFLDQDSSWVTNETFDGQVYVTDFFFTTCPTICPTMKAQMLRIYDKYKDNPEVALLSHTIDPAHDDVRVLHDFAKKLGVESAKWHFVTGDKDKIYEQGMKGYMVTAGQDSSAPGGYIHSGAFILVDKDRRIRGLYDGTVEADVNELMDDIQILLAEYKEPK